MIIRDKIYSSYHKYLNTLFNPEEDTTYKNFWKYINARKQDTLGIGTLNAKGKIAKTSLKKTNILNEQFKSVFTKKKKRLGKVVPQQKAQQKNVKQVQHNAARIVNNKPYNPENPDSVTSMI